MPIDRASFKKRLFHFYQIQPLFFWGLTTLISSFLFLEQSFWIALIWIVFLSLISIKRAFFHAALLLLFSFYCSQILTPSPESGFGRGVFSIHSLEKQKTPFQSRWLYKGVLLGFESESKYYPLHLPCSFVYQGNASLRPKANCNYLLTGELVQKSRFLCSFKPKHFEPLKKGFSLAELRMKTKERIYALLKQRMDRKSADFLCSLFTGEINDRMIQHSFAKLGLQHILAISGFHFALIAAFLGALFQLFLPYRARLWALLACFLAYYLFVGNNPSVQRSFLAASLFFIGTLLQRNRSPLNLLGACMLIEILLNPLAPLHIGFQLSFLSCTAILLINRPISQAIERYLPKHSIHTAGQLSLFAQCALIVNSLGSRALAITLSVNLALWPLLLFHFHRFPFICFLYNLFIPALVALCLFLLITALLVHLCIPLFAIFFFQLAQILSKELLELISNPPPLLNITHYGSFPLSALLLYLGALFSWGIWRTSAHIKIGS